MLLGSGPLPAGTVAEAFAISRPAVSRHLRVLREAGLVVDTVAGRQRIYRLDTAPLAELVDWLTSIRLEEATGAGDDRDAWGARFDALTTEVHRTRRESCLTDSRPPMNRRTEPETDAEERTA